MSEVREALTNLLGAINGDERFITYEIAKREIEESEEFVKRVNEFREKNYVIQNNLTGQKLEQEISNLECEYQETINNPIVRNYLNAEVSLCRMMNEINESLLEIIHLELRAKGE